MLVLAGAYFFIPGSLSDNNGLFVVSEGESVDSVIGRLVEAGYVRNRTVFHWSLLWSGLSTRIQPGQHDLTGVRSYSGIIRRLAEPDEAGLEVTLLLREGETLRDLQSSLVGLGLDKAADDLFVLTGQPAIVGSVDPSVMERLKNEYDFLMNVPDQLGLEGFLFPDTYRLYRDASASDVIHRLLDNFGQKVWLESKTAITSSDRTLFEIVTMASILEREVRGVEDMGLVSDIFWRRLDVGMPLQADSTVNYATNGDSPSVSYEDTRFDSPFNTYLYRGLPVGPIGNPGVEAIQAAFNPESNTFWYFLTDTEGDVHYARTLQEHNSNKSRYLKR